MSRKITLAELKALALATNGSLHQLAAGVGRVPKIYIHWSAGHYSQQFSDYHIQIDSDGAIYAVDDLSVHLDHTYMRNTGAVSIGAMCAYEATTVNFGPEPPTDEQVEAIGQVVAVLAEALQLPVDIEHVMTHAEAADNLDGYNPGYADATGYPNNTYGPASNCERWDFWMLKPDQARGSGGNIIRGKANWYLAHPA